MASQTHHTQAEDHPARTRKPWELLSLLAVWLAIVSTGLLGLAQYSQGAGESSPPPNARHLGLKTSPHRHTLVMSVHPKCPCTKASVYELERLAKKCQGLMDITVLVYEPTTTKDSWSEPDPFRLGTRLPNATIIRDQDGKTAARLGSLTSGAVVLYDATGNPAFWGGITSGRGHAGDNLGSDAILNLVQGKTPRNTNTPVYGCSINNPQTMDTGTDSARNQACPMSGACHE